MPTSRPVVTSGKAELAPSGGAAGLDRFSPLPYYYQLIQLVRAMIDAGGLGPGDRLPGDHDLGERYNVSRTVVRQALRELEFEGVIERVKGRGTFVAACKRTEGWVQSFTGLSEDVRARGGEIHSLVRRSEIVPADELVAADLQIEAGAAVVEVERLRFVDGEPWALTVNQLPLEFGEPLLKEDLTTASLYDLLQNKYGVVLLHGQRCVEAAAATKDVAKALGLTRGGPVLVLRSLTRGQGGVPVERFVAFHRGDRSRFQVDVDRDHLRHLTTSAVGESLLAPQ